MISMSFSGDVFILRNVFICILICSNVSIDTDVREIAFPKVIYKVNFKKLPNRGTV